MNYGEIKNYDVANGPGVRVTLFVSGCRHHCEGCFNPDTWDFAFGKPYTEETEAEILKMLGNRPIKGLTLLGGEPMEPENQKALLLLLQKAKALYPEKDIWCFTGYRLDEDILKKMLPKYEFTGEMLKYIDVMVDGEFVLKKRNLMLKFKGSENQRIILVPETLEKGEIVRWPEDSIEEE
jgi:anaerobic ribonucleoside-triphosphate reductase activating protein